MQTLLRATDPAGFLAMVPALVGMRVSNSLVMVMFRDQRSRETMRVDLPNSPNQEHAQWLANACVSFAARCGGANGIATVVFATESLTASEVLPWRGLSNEVHLKMQQAGYRKVLQLCVGADGWADYGADTSGTPRPLQEIEDARLRAGLPLAMVEMPDPAATARLPKPDRRLSARVDSLTRLLLAGWSAAPESPGALDPSAVAPTIAELPEQIEALLANVPQGPVTPETHTLANTLAHTLPSSLALLAACASQPLIRDPMMLQIAFGLQVGRLAFDMQTNNNGPGAHQPDTGDRWTAEKSSQIDASELSKVLIDMITGATRTRPDVRRCRLGIALLLRAAANSQPRFRPGLLCVAGWLNWALGRSTAAAVLMSNALQIDADHGMSQLLLSLIDSGRVPEWAFSGADSFSGSDSNAGSDSIAGV